MTTKRKRYVNPVLLVIKAAQEAEKIRHETYSIQTLHKLAEHNRTKLVPALTTAYAVGAGFAAGSQPDRSQADPPGEGEEREGRQVTMATVQEHMSVKLAIMFQLPIDQAREIVAAEADSWRVADIPLPW